MGIYIDLQKAFGTVNHFILIQKLEKYGVRGLVLDCFRSYLNNRKQYTVISDINPNFRLLLVVYHKVQF